MLVSCPIYSDPNDFYILPRHFTACNQWVSKGDTFITDQWGDRYRKEPLLLTRFKCFLLTLFAAPVHTLLAPWNCVRTVQEKSPLLEKIARIALTPLTILAMTFSVLYGILMPWNGRKLYATLERLHYHQAFLAPCFQPSSDQHSRRKIVNEVEK